MTEAVKNAFRFSANGTTKENTDLDFRGLAQFVVLTTDSSSTDDFCPFNETALLMRFRCRNPFCYEVYIVPDFSAFGFYCRGCCVEDLCF